MAAEAAVSHIRWRFFVILAMAMAMAMALDLDLDLHMATIAEAEPRLAVGFYRRSCPGAEEVVAGAVREAVRHDPTVAASLLRLMFHDCFVQGCDGSILLEQKQQQQQEEEEEAVEKAAVPNQSLRGFEAVDTAKAAVEAVCPGVVSCADILVLAARDAVVLAGGPTWEVPTGRRDGTTSSAVAATLALPQPTFTTPILTQMFLSHGLSQDDMITLSGAHTIGHAHCSSFSERLAMNDLTMDVEYATKLRHICPPNADPSIRVPLDPTTPFLFDKSYFTNLAFKRGLLTSDQDLHDNLVTKFNSDFDSSNTSLWERKFPLAMVRLSSLNVLLGSAGEVRYNCRSTNSF